MSLLESMPVQAPRSFSRSPQPAQLGVELFATRQEAEARIEHWLRLGQRNVWLHEVTEVTTADCRIEGRRETSFPPFPGSVIYALVKVG
ncbi:MAG: hypothetical protein HYV95_05170 [Opitutae bacterium]|nr:hypothetical protein [Opitutae bacterium]